LAFGRTTTPQAGQSQKYMQAVIGMMAAELTPQAGQRIEVGVR